MLALPDSAADQLAADHGKNIARMAVKSFDSMLADIAAGTNPRQAIADAQSAFTTRYAKSLAKAFSDLLQRFVGVAEVRAMPVGDVPLSARLYAHNEVTAAQAAAIIREHAQGIHDARALAMRLYDGYDPQGAADRPLEGRARAELPAALRNLTADRDARASLQALVDKGLARAARLKTPALRAAYLEAFNAWAAGAGAEILRARLDVAVREKNRYMASRISRTELARAHQATDGAALMADPLVSVVQVLLNPMHPHTDICDLHAKADLFGLGPGCYPKARAPLSPFHPHCWCKIRARYDLSAADAREVPHGVALHLRGMPPAVAARIMGSEARALEVMAGTPVREVLNRGVDPAYQFRRLGDGVQKPFPPVPVPVPPLVKPAPPPVPAPPPATHLEFIAEGRRIMETLPAVAADAQFADVRAWHTAMFDRLRAENIIGKAAEFTPQRGAVPLGALRAQMDEASAMYPRTWVAAADAAGPLTVKGSSSRCWAWTADRDRPIGVSINGWRVDRHIARGEGFMTVGPGDLSVTIHEYGHRLQETVKGLDAIFQALHRERVVGAPVRRIKDVGPAYRGYGADEVTREDHYRNAYQGREYRVRGGGAEDGGALEVLTMAFEAIVGGQAPGKTSATLASVSRLRDMLLHDREMVELVVGLLFRFNPIA